jgi:hypothetical protein
MFAVQMRTALIKARTSIDCLVEISAQALGGELLAPNDKDVA